MKFKLGDILEVITIRDFPFRLLILLPNGEKHLMPIQNFDPTIEFRPEPGDQLLGVVTKLLPENKYAIGTRPQQIEAHGNGKVIKMPQDLKDKIQGEITKTESNLSSPKWGIGEEIEVVMMAVSLFVIMVKMPDGGKNWIQPNEWLKPYPENGKKFRVVILAHRRDGRCQLGPI